MNTQTYLDAISKAIADLEAHRHSLGADDPSLDQSWLEEYERRNAACWRAVRALGDARGPSLTRTTPRGGSPAGSE